jgi:hypothetical protein
MQSTLHAYDAQVMPHAALLRLIEWTCAIRVTVGEAVDRRHDIARTRAREREGERERERERDSSKRAGEGRGRAVKEPEKEAGGQSSSCHMLLVWSAATDGEWRPRGAMVMRGAAGLQRVLLRRPHVVRPPPRKGSQWKSRWHKRNRRGAHSCPLPWLISSQYNLLNGD